MNGRLDVDDRLRIAENVYVAGPEMDTHPAHYQGDMAARLALGMTFGRIIRPFRAPSTPIRRAARWASRWRRPRSGASTRSSSAWDLGTTAKGYVAEAQGHATIVVDRKERILIGAFLAGPGVSETIHEAVLAIKLRTPLAVLADTIHAFPTVARGARHRVRQRSPRSRRQRHTGPLSGWRSPSHWARPLA